MNVKQFFPMMIMFAAPVLGVQAQNKSGLDLTNIDKSAKPADDFYQYATGGWQKNNPLPAAYSRFGSFDLLQDNVNKQVNIILTDLAKKKYKDGTTERKLSDFYKLAMDVHSRNASGITPVKPLLNEIESTETKDALQQLQLKYGKQGYGFPFASYFGAEIGRAHV